VSNSSILIDISPVPNPRQLNNTLDNFFKRFINTQNNSLAQTNYDPEWPSPCQQSEPFKNSKHANCIHWLPIQRKSNSDLDGLEKALEIDLHPALKTFFTRYWSEQIDCIFQQGNLSLLFLWSDKDMERLIKNQIGHALNKIRNKQTLTFFIACTDSDYMISIDNQSGQVVLERSGYPIEKILSSDLNSFLNELEYGRLSI
jgi:SecY interacting protein Syd